MAVAAQVGCGVRVLVLLALSTFSLRATTYYVTVAGLGGTPEYSVQFAKWASELGHELEKNGPDAHVVTLASDAATRVAVELALAKVAREAKAEDSFALFLMGHGTFDGMDYKFNLPGPDVSAAELALWINRIPAARQLVVNMTSCSGASVTALARTGRIVITATKSGTEKNATVFPRYWIDGMRDPAADTDKNGILTTLELYRYTTQKTAAYFEAEKLLATEHPAMTDSGKVTAARDPKPENGQGLLAARFAVLEPEHQAAKNLAPEKQRLVQKKEDLEAKIDKLKYAKAAMAPDDYKQQLTALLVELARTQAAIDR